MKIYCISGLGADKRVFQFLDLPNHKLVHLEWIEPEPKETLPQYALRLAEKIDDSEPYALLGLSFGGMLAIEIAKVYHPLKLFVLSSITGKNEVPLLHRFAGAIKLHEIIPAQILKTPNFLTYMAFGLETPESKAMLDDILNETDPDFLVWAIGAIFNWKNETEVPMVRIHGNKDKILPVNMKNVQYRIENGGHFAIIDRAKEFSEFINKELLEFG